MAFDATQVLIPGKGTVFYGAINIAPPVKSTLDPATPSTFTGWTLLGHTSRENPPALTKEGGETTTRGSWWDDALVSSTSARTWSLAIASLQVETTTLALAFPAGRVTDGGYYVPSASGTVEKGIYVYSVDGVKTMGIYLPRVSLGIGDAPAISVDNFFEISLNGACLSATASIAGKVQIGDVLAIYPPVALV